MFHSASAELLRLSNSFFSIEALDYSSVAADYYTPADATQVDFTQKSSVHPSISVSACESVDGRNGKDDAIVIVDQAIADFQRSDSIDPAVFDISSQVAVPRTCCDVSVVHVSEQYGEKFPAVSETSLPANEGKLRMLDLFCGTGSVGRKFSEQGYEVVSVDFRKSEHPTLCVDVLRWKFKMYPVSHFDVIAASPPCGNYSLANNLRPGKFHRADRLVKKTVEIIQYFKPRL